MQPNFALNFSSDGLELLHRVSSGWQSLGTADFAAEDLAGQLKALLDQAHATGDQPIRTRLLLPHEQIRFLTIENTAADEGDEEALVRRSLEGTTPYPVEALAFSWIQDGASLSIAAIVTETLDEAEDFAAQHGFAPVCFAAQAAPGQFGAEPFFGMTGFSKTLADVTSVDQEGPVRANSARGKVAGHGNAPAPAQAEAADGNTTATPPATDKKLPTSVDLPSKSELKRERDLTLSPERPADLPPSSDGLTESEAMISASISSLSPARDAAPDGGAPAAPSQSHDREKERLTVFGARSSDADRKRRPLWLILTIALFIIMFTVAALAAMNRDRLSGFFDFLSGPQQISSAGLPGSDSATAPQIGAAPEADEAPRDLERVSPEAAPRDSSPASTQQPELDQPATALATPPAISEPATPAEAAARYAATGIWLRAPSQSVAPVPSELGTLTVDTVSAVDRLPTVGSLPEEDRPQVGSPFRTPPNPPTPDQRFDLDDRGLVRATEDGAMTPAGHMVYLGAPASVPPARPAATLPDTAAGAQTQAETSATTAEDAGAESDASVEENDTVEESVEDAVAAALAEVRPRARPEDLVSEDELEPEDELQNEDEGAETEEFADALSLRPKARPSGFNTVVAAAQALANSAPVAPTERTVQPSLPSNASVSRQATETRAINLNDINLLGVMGRPSDRSALVRLSNGRVVRVKVGDRLDGGRVAAIGDTELRYVKSNRNHVLNMPGG